MAICDDQVPPATIMRQSQESLYRAFVSVLFVLVWRKVVEGDSKRHSQPGSKSDPIHMSVLTT